MVCSHRENVFDTKRVDGQFQNSQQQFLLKCDLNMYRQSVSASVDCS